MRITPILKSWLEPLRRALSGGNEVLKRYFKIGEYWYWIEGDSLTERIEINSMVYPYRYDILLRKQFFDMYRTQHKNYQEDARLLIQDARASGYFIWFKEVLARRYRQDLLADEQALHAAFEQRVFASAKIYDSIVENGFDSTRPIIPYTAENIIAIGGDKVASKQYFMGDGCHRLACLLSMGFTELPSNFLRVKCFRTYKPFDNTSLLAPFFSQAADWQHEASAIAAQGLDLDSDCKVTGESSEASFGDARHD